jgi:hypothetical protein
MAVAASVTVSIAAEMTGIWSGIALETLVRTSASEGTKSDSPGRSRISSKVSATGYLSFPSTKRLAQVVSFTIVQSQGYGKRKRSKIPANDRPAAGPSRNEEAGVAAPLKAVLG